MKRELLDFCKQIPVHPMIIVLDDFHLADVTSVDLLAYLATRLESTRVLVVICYRPVEMNRSNQPFAQVRSDLVSRGACTELALPPLTRKHVTEYLATRQSNTNYTPDLLHAKSDGNPLFMLELANRKTISDSIRLMIQNKIDSLDDTHQQLLVTASVQGREFDSAVLAATMQMNSVDVEDTLQELDQTYGIIRRIREEELPDGKFTVRYRFVYGLYQEACYASLAPTRKASLSASLAEAFLTYYGQ
jgi:predicted ATPase